MFKKRLIGVLTIKDSHCVQSKKFSEYLPLGKALFLVENLDSWNVDEIIINCIDRTRKGKGPDIDLLMAISNLGISTPLTYGGGISSVKDAVNIIRNGADRVMIDQLIYKDKKILEEINDTLGKQAIVYSCPVLLREKKLYHYNYINKREEEIKKWLNKYINEDLFSEILIIDSKNEGLEDKFDLEILDKIPSTKNPLILFGGLTNPIKIKKLLDNKRIVGICIGNSLSFRENNVHEFKSRINSPELRKEVYDNRIGFI